MTILTDPIPLAQALIRCESVTPIEGGALTLLQSWLEQLGFTCHRQVFEEKGFEPVDNLYARFGDGSNNLCFAGHTDVVPVGDKSGWTYPPFAAEIHNGVLYGRGTEDMKGAIACWVAAMARYLESTPSPNGSLSLLITGDEEADAVNGTVKMLGWMQDNHETLDACIVGEPTNPTEIGQMAKIGRRGSISATITVTGTQGHVAYPHLADNPSPKLVAMLHRIQQDTLDNGTEFFPPSSLQITTIDIGNPADNVIPAKATATLNIRFNDRHSSDSLKRRIENHCAAITDKVEIHWRVSGEAFLTKPGPLSGLVVKAVKEVTGNKPELSTTGGTSDARFIKNYCPVVEFGATGKTPHKVNECVRIDDLHTLSRVYEQIIAGYFS